MWIKSAGRGFEEITEERVLLCGLDGEVRSGTGTRHVEWPIHSRIYLARPDVGAVVHSHAEGAVAFAATGLPMTPLSHEGALFSPPDLPRFTRSGDLIRTAEMGDALAAVLADRNAVLIPHHGLVTVGPTVVVAVMTALFLDKACRVQLTAAATGRELSCSDDAEALSKRGNCFSDVQLMMAWDYLVRTRST